MRVAASRHYLRLLVTGFLGVLILWQCAYKAAPSGGPEDKTPPEIIYTFPAQDSTGIKSLPYLEFRFSETVNQSSFNNQTWLLPELPGGYELEWKGGKTLRALLQDSLEEDQTYIFTIGTGIKDLRGNTLPSPFVLPFSTGPEIDQGEIAGVIFDKTPQNIFIYAYQASDTFSNRTVFERKPRYYTQTGKEGNYRLRYLNEATYRVYALDDKNGDRKYTLQTDRIGIPFRDITIDSARGQYQNINFYMTREDSTAPQLNRAGASHQRLLSLWFNEPLDQAQRFAVEIIDSLSAQPLLVRAAMLDLSEPKRLMVYTAAQMEVTYLGSLSAVKDTAGNFSEEDFIEFDFRGSAASDTAQPRLISTQPADNAREVDYDATVQLRFSQPIDSASLKDGFQLLSSDTLDTLPVVGKWRFLSLLEPQFIPDTLLEKNQSYQIQLDLANMRTIFGDSLGDSVYVSHFVTRDWSQLGEIAGVVSSADTTHKQAVVWATPLRGGGVYSASSAVGKPYLLEFLPEGLYLMKAGIDLNENGAIDAGSSLPFQFSEPVIGLPDTIKVRKRWTTEGVNFRF